MFSTHLVLKTRTGVKHGALLPHWRSAQKRSEIYLATLAIFAYSSA
jgi:hypothetical protein